MKDDSRCEDSAALIGLLYDDCDAQERARISAHLAVCAACATELAALSATREHLSAWAPPDLQLGFRVGQVDAAPRSTSWWSRPMPAWAQLAAAVVVFAAGTAVGMASVGRQPLSRVDPVGASATQAALSRLEQRLQEVEARPIVPVARVPLDSAANDALLARMTQMVHDSEKRQQRELAYQTYQLIRDMQNLDQSVRTAQRASNSLSEPMRVGFLQKGASD